MVVFLLFFSCLCWSLGWTPERWWPVGGFQGAGLRGLGAAICIFAALAFSKTVRNLFPHEPMTTQVRWGTVSALSQSICSGCFVVASTYIQGFASTSLAYTSPLFFAVLGPLFGIKLAGVDIAAAVGDAFSVGFFLSDNWGSIRLTGVIIGLLAGLTWAINLIALPKIGPRVKVLSFGIGSTILGLLAMPALLTGGMRLDYVAYHLVGGAFTLALPIFTFAYAQPRAKSAIQPLVITSVEPVPSALWGYLFFQESFTWKSITGMFLCVFVAIFHALWTGREKKARG